MKDVTKNNLLEQELCHFTTEELKHELKRREEEAKPKPLKDIDFKPLINICEDFIKYLNSGETNGNGDEHYIYNCALECIYGKDVWVWIDGKLK